MEHRQKLQRKRPFLQTAGLAPGMRRCGRCQKELPASADWFDRDETKEGGFKLWCKKCRKERREVSRLAKAANVVETIDKAVLANLTDARPGGSLTPHQLEFLQCTTAMCGGVQGVAMLWLAQLTAAPPGSAERGRMLAQYLRLMEVCSADSKVTPPAEMMSDEELNAAIARDEERMRRNEQKLREGGVIDAS